MQCSRRVIGDATAAWLPSRVATSRGTRQVRMGQPRDNGALGGLILRDCRYGLVMGGRHCTRKETRNEAIHR